MTYTDPAIFPNITDDDIFVLSHRMTARWIAVRRGQRASYPDEDWMVIAFQYASTGVRHSIGSDPLIDLLIAGVE